MDSFLLGLASFGLVLIPLVIIHEFGHFLAAKLVGITVLEFGIGFPPRAKIMFTRGDTIYTLNWLPIGGFVRPYGESFVRPKTPDELVGDQAEIKERGIENPKSVFDANPWQRMFFMAAGPGINLIAAWVLFVMIALVGQPFSKADVTIYEVFPGSSAAQLQPGDVVRTVNGATIQSADEFNDLIRQNANKPVTLHIERNNQPLDITFTATPVQSRDIERVYVTTLEKDMPAYKAGLKVEDVIIAVDGIEVTSISQLQSYTKQHEGTEIQVTVLRGGEPLVIPIAPKKDSQGVVRMGIGISGVEPAIVGLTAVNRNEETYTRALPVGKALQTGTDEFTTAQRILVDFFRDVVTGKVALKEARPVSPIGIGQIGGPILEQSLNKNVSYPIVTFAALISIALAVTNLLPVPGLDGGRILFVAIEIIRGKPMSPEREGVIHFIGMLLLLGLIALTVINDIINPITVQSIK